MEERVAPACRAIESGTIANVTVDERAGQAAARRRSRDDDKHVSTRGKCTHDGLPQIPGAARHEYLHLTATEATETEVTEETASHRDAEKRRSTSCSFIDLRYLKTPRQ